MLILDMRKRIYEYIDYKKYINDLIYDLPKHGRGQYSKIADYVGVNSVVISQIFKGTRELSAEQALLITKYFGFEKLEKEYFINLVLKEKAANHELKSYFNEILLKIKSDGLKIKNVVDNKELDESAKAEFYSSWYYSGVRLCTLLPGCGNNLEIAKKLNLSIDKANLIIEFLIKHGLLKKENNKLAIGPLRTHLPSDSQFVSRHHTNWRLKGIEKMDKILDHELFYTSPMTISKKDMEELKLQILDFISKLSKRIKDSKDEKLVCFNLDLFEV